MSDTLPSLFQIDQRVSWRPEAYADGSPGVFNAFCGTVLAVKFRKGAVTYDISFDDGTGVMDAFSGWVHLEVPQETEVVTSQ